MIHGMAEPEAGRRHARNSTKGAGKIVLVLKSQIKAHIQNGQAGLSKQFASTVDPALKNEPVRAETCTLPKLSCKIVHTQIRVVSELCEADVFAQMNLNVFEHALQARRRQAYACRSRSRTLGFSGAAALGGKFPAYASGAA